MESDNTALAEEAKQEGESPEEEGAEQGVVIPEEFQKKVHEVVSQAKDRHHVNHMRDQLNAHEDKLREEAAKKAEKESKGSRGKVKPSDKFSVADMPRNY